MDNLFLYGSGKRCQILLNLLDEVEMKVSGVVDSDSTKWGKIIENYEICSPDILKNVKNGYVCVTFYSSLVEEPIWNRLREDYNIPGDRIVSFHDLLIRIFARKDMVDDLKMSKGQWKTLFDGSWELELGGVEAWLKDVVWGLVECGYKELYLVTKKNQMNMPIGIKDYIIDFCLYNTPKFMEKHIREGVRLILHELPCTIVFSRVDELMLAAYLVKQKYPNEIKIVMVDHGSCDGMYRDILSYQSGIDYYMCVSSGIKEELVKRGVSSRQVTVMTCPVQYDISLERTYSLDMNSPVQIGYAGRLEIFEKRIDILMEVLIKLEEKKVNYHFSIAGDGTQYAAVEDYVREKNICERVSLLGRINHDRICEFWKKQDIAVNTSDNEGRPLSNMEAMINGAVPVVTRTIGILDDVVDGRNGYIVPIEDAEAMADRILYLAMNRTLIREFGMRARQEMLCKSDRKKHIEMWKSVLTMMR
ncbi:MAG: glycosyltransferase family 4 protein [Lachnospiraceae bacterium]|nr:glycosyltransferase family 4 protein [Lachnospiraceae bacterium]